MAWAASPEVTWVNSHHVVFGFGQGKEDVQEHGAGQQQVLLHLSHTMEGNWLETPSLQNTKGFLEIIDS